MTRRSRRAAHSHHFHPDLRAIATKLPNGSFHPRLVPLVRAASRWKFRTVPDGVEVLTLSSGVGVRLYRPESQGSTAALLWIHGGGLVFGSAPQDDQLCLKFASTLGITVASVEYRLAPEHLYPAALQDCYAALLWLSTLPAVDPSRIAIGGASAGAGLATALAGWARDRGEVTPAFQLLTYPMLDDRATPLSPKDAERYRLWGESDNRFAWSAYLGGADPAVAVPGRQTDLRGLAPAWIGVATFDLFYAEGLAYADRLRTAGVPCEIDVVPGAFHGFDSVAPKSGVARTFFETRCAALRTALTLSQGPGGDPNLALQPRRRMS